MQEQRYLRGPERVQLPGELFRSAMPVREQALLEYASDGHERPEEVQLEVSGIDDCHDC